MKRTGKPDRLVVYRKPQDGPDHVAGQLYEAGWAVGYEVVLQSQAEAEAMADLHKLDHHFILYLDGALKILHRLTPPGM